MRAAVDVERMRSRRPEAGLELALVLLLLAIVFLLIAVFA